MSAMVKKGLSSNVDIYERQLEGLKKTCTLALSLNAELTKKLILPVIKNTAEVTTSEEVTIEIAIQLKNLVQIYHDRAFVSEIMVILYGLCSTDEPLVIANVVSAIQKTSEYFAKEQFKDELLPIIQKLCTHEWSLQRSTGISLISATYGDFDQESKNLLRSIVVAAIRQDDPLIRKAAAECLIVLAPQLEKEVIIEYTDLLYNLCNDNIDSVKLCSISLIIAYGNKLSKPEFDEYVKQYLDALCASSSWRVHQMLANKISELLRCCGGSDNLLYTTNLLNKLLTHTEVEVQIEASKNLLKFCEAAKENCDSSGRNFDVFFKEYFQNIICEIMHEARNCEVKIALSKDIVSFAKVLSDNTFRQIILANLIEWLQNESIMSVQENVLLNLNNIPKNVDISDLIEPLRTVITKVLVLSGLNWRARRNLVIAFSYLTKTLPKESFDDKFKMYYLKLAKDKIFAVRRSVPMIMPIFAKQYGFEWLSKSLIPHYMVLSDDSRYLYNYLPMYCMNELIFPTLEEKGVVARKYLSEFQDLKDSPDAKKGLYKVQILFNKIKARLGSEHFQKVLKSDLPEYSTSNDMQLYGEETCKILQNKYRDNFYSRKCSRTCSYIEGILTSIYKIFLDILTVLSDSKVENTKIYSKYTIKNINKLLDSVQAEMNQSWVQEVLGKLSAEEKQQFEEELENYCKEKFNVDMDEVDDVKMSVSFLGNIRLDEISSSDIEKTMFMDLDEADFDLVDNSYATTDDSTTNDETTSVSYTATNESSKVEGDTTDGSEAINHNESDNDGATNNDASDSDDKMSTDDNEINEETVSKGSGDSKINENSENGDDNKSTDDDKVKEDNKSSDDKTDEIGKVNEDSKVNEEVASNDNNKINEDNKISGDNTKTDNDDNDNNSDHVESTDNNKIDGEISIN
ncbi:probable serine/threonine-protein phosphatase PP2A regulatory subunit [Aethina tumida]|uniref:probable serine/threonine-protein phosphatase PP2A regulatory subunit n=1 Tax=Aethina tumida TaxID=116153 RepID=UPI00214980E4|nr:probable serine/threonine-protein phosphatase PP2A regulatory subunit [Aethina tumida]